MYNILYILYKVKKAKNNKIRLKDLMDFIFIHLSILIVLLFLVDILNRSSSDLLSWYKCIEKIISLFNTNNNI